MALQMSVKVADRGALTTGLRKRVAAFVDLERQARTASAAIATQVTKSKVPHTRPSAPSRPGRPHTTDLATVIRWRPLNSGGVGLNVSELDATNRYWPIQEIGTGERATVHVGGRPNPSGRPAKDATYIKTVKSQRGRRISSGLVFATGPGGTWSPPGSAHGQQLYPRQLIKGVRATRNRSQAGIVIREEIVGRHFVRDGGEAGFREYRSLVLAAARTQLRKRRT